MAMKVKKESKALGPHNHTGLLIKKAREEAGITQRALAKAINYAQHQFICHIEQGISPLPHKYILPIASRLNIDPMLLVDSLIQDLTDKLIAEVAPRGNRATVLKTVNTPTPSAASPAPQRSGSSRASPKKAESRLRLMRRAS